MTLRLSLLRAVFLAVLLTVTRADLVHHECHRTARWMPVNALSVLQGEEHMRHIKSVSHGELWSVQGSGVDFEIVHVWGTAYNKGFAMGQLFQDELLLFLRHVWNHVEKEIESGVSEAWGLPSWLAKYVADLGLAAALDLTAQITKSFTGQYFFDELDGMCAGAGHHIDSGCFDMLVRIHMLAGLTQGKCSLFGAWGGATQNGHTLQLRALDWDMQGPFRTKPLITVHHADGKETGNTFLTVGFLGFIGALTGVSSQQLGISEIGVSFPDASFGEEGRVGYPFIWLLRDVLQFDSTVDDAINRMINTQRTCDLILAVGDGKEEEVRGMQYSFAHLRIQDDENMRPDNGTWHFRLPHMIYWGMDWLCPGYSKVLGTQLLKHHGTLNATTAIRDVVGVTGSGDLHVAVYDLTAGDIFVAFASSAPGATPEQAYARRFTHFNLKSLFTHPQE